MVDEGRGEGRLRPLTGGCPLPLVWPLQGVRLHPPSLLASVRRCPPPQSCNFVLFRVNARPGVGMDGRRLSLRPSLPLGRRLSARPGLSGSSRIPPPSPSPSASPRFSCVLSITSSPPSNLPEREREREVLERKGTSEDDGGRKKEREAGRGAAKGGSRGDQI